MSLEFAIHWHHMIESSIEVIEQIPAGLETSVPALYPQDNALDLMKILLELLPAGLEKSMPFLVSEIERCKESEEDPA